MGPLIGASLISGGASLLGGLFGSSSSAKAAAKAAQLNIMAAQNAHQWEVRDLRKAGLNPILSATGGPGAHTAAAPVADTSDIARGIADAGAKAASAYQLKLMDAQAENLDSQTRLNNQNYALDKYFKPLERMQSLTTGRTALEQTRATTENIREGLYKLKADITGQQITNQEARRLLDRKLADPEFQNYMDSATYAERKELGEILKNPDSEDLINFLLRIIGR